MYTHSPNPSKQYATLRKIRGSRDQAISGYFAPQEQIPWVRGCHGLTLNFDKCQFLQPKLEFFGLNFSADGVRPDPKKVYALATATMPTTVSEVRSLLGMANYSSQFIPNHGTINHGTITATRPQRNTFYMDSGTGPCV
jgi:hypothetical protein